MASIDLTLVSKPGCHLCDDARTVVLDVIASLAAPAPSATQATDDPPIAVDFSEVSIFDDQALYDEHVEDIPVVLINGRVHTFWRVDPVRLTTALRASATTSPAATSFATSASASATGTSSPAATSPAASSPAATSFAAESTPPRPSGASQGAPS